MIKARHPFVLFFGFIAVLTVTMCTYHPFFLFLSLCGALLFRFLLGRPALKELIFTFLLFLLTVMINPLFSHNGKTVLFFLNDMPITAEAILRGGATALMLLAVYFWCSAFTRIFKSAQFMYLFGSVLPKSTLVISMALRFFPEIIRLTSEGFRIRCTGEKTYRDRLRIGLGVIGTVIGIMLEKTLDTADAMRARGYGTGKRTAYRAYSFTGRDAVFLLVLFLLSGIAFFGVIRFGRITFFPAVSYTSPPSIVRLLTGCFFFAPAFLEGKEIVLWKYSVSKM